MRIVIVGLGLIGGSLAAACRKAFPKSRVIGVTRNRFALAKAKKKGWIHEGYRDLKKAFQGRFRGTRLETVPFVVVCTPVDTLKNFLLQLDRLAPPGTIVTDAGSVKGFLVRWAERRRWKRIQYVGAHPMAGSHERGINYARPDLFKEAVTFVTPGRRDGVTRSVINFWKKISERVVLISAGEHDRITSEISHLPHLIASALVASVSAKSLRFSANGFLDTTRIAGSDPDLWTPIFQENRKELFRALGAFESRLIFLKRTLKKGNRGRLKRFLEASQRRRKSLSSGGGPAFGG